MPQPEPRLLPRQRQVHPIKAYARRMQSHPSLATECSSLLIPLRGTVRAFGQACSLLCPLQTSALRSAPISQHSANFSRTRDPRAQSRSPKVRHRTVQALCHDGMRGRPFGIGRSLTAPLFPRVDAEFIKHVPNGRMEDFAVTCPLVPNVPHLRSGSCTSPRAFGLSFLQTPPHDDALALLLVFGFSFT